MGCDANNEKQFLRMQGPTTIMLQSRVSTESSAWDALSQQDFQNLRAEDSEILPKKVEDHSSSKSDDQVHQSKHPVSSRLKTAHVSQQGRVTFQ